MVWWGGTDVDEQRQRKQDDQNHHGLETDMCMWISTLKEYKIYIGFNLEVGICYSPKWFKLMSQWPDSFFYHDALVATYVQHPDHTNVTQLHMWYLFFHPKTSIKNSNASLIMRKK
jgi:hypothetical protein